jgi:hypothetical protein
VKGAWKFVRAQRQVKHVSLDGSAANGVVYGVHTTTPVRRPLRRAAAAAALLAVAVGLGCGPDPFAPRADTPVVRTIFTVWAISGSPAPYPTAYSVQSNATLRLEPTGAFDLAFDITPEGKLRVLPVREVVNPISGARSIGVQVPGIPYADITAAPRTGYALDSIIELEVGGAFVVQVPSQLCGFSQQPVIFAKFNVDTIVPADRRAFLSGRINPNCGFRSFADGVPEF